jgi:predicted nucleic acid-binding protein
MQSMIKPISQFDAMIVAMARSRGASLATRNVKDLERRAPEWRLRITNGMG